MPKPTYLIDEASELMLTVTYPALIDVVRDLGLREVVVELHDFYDMHITSEGRIYYINNNRMQVDISKHF